MRNIHKTIVGMAVAAALAASTGSIYAQTADSGGAGTEARQERGGPGMMHRGHGERRGHDMWSNPAAKVEGYLAALKVELKITPNQENAWQAFAGKVRQQADAMIARRAQMKARFEQMKGQAPAEKLTAPERLTQRTERMKQHLASMETMTVAVKDLYGALTPEQKTIADKQLARGPFGGRGGERGGHRGHGGFGGHGGEHGDRR